jgi:hypothetical protein
MRQLTLFRALAGITAELLYVAALAGFALLIATAAALLR